MQLRFFQEQHAFSYDLILGTFTTGLWHSSSSRVKSDADSRDDSLSYSPFFFKTNLSRSAVHATTIKGGLVVPDYKHITVAYKTETLGSRGLHQTLHGNIQPDGGVVASVGKILSSDNYCPFPSKPLWPTGLGRELVFGRAAPASWIFHHDIYIL